MLTQLFHSSIKFVVGLSFIASLSGCTAIMYAANDGPIEVNPYKRTFGQYLDDKKLRRVIIVNLKKESEELKYESHVNIKVYNGVVLLTGEVPSENARSVATRTVKKIYQVRQVHNELVVAKPKSFGSRFHDNWLQTKVKSKIFGNRKTHSDYFKVIVENDVVFLMGTVSRDEADKATELARTTKGVKKVVRVFEYIDA